MLTGAAMARPIVQQAHGLLRRELLLQASRYVLHLGSGLVAGASLIGTATPGARLRRSDGRDPREVVREPRWRIMPGAPGGAGLLLS